MFFLLSWVQSVGAVNAPQLQTSRQHRPSRVSVSRAPFFKVSLAIYGVISPAVLVALHLAKLYTLSHVYMPGGVGNYWRPTYANPILNKPFCLHWSIILHVGRTLTSLPSNLRIELTWCPFTSHWYIISMMCVSMYMYMYWIRFTLKMTHWAIPYTYLIFCIVISINNNNNNNTFRGKWVIHRKYNYRSSFKKIICEKYSASAVGCKLLCHIYSSIYIPWLPFPWSYKTLTLGTYICNSSYIHHNL